MVLKEFLLGIVPIGVVIFAALGSIIMGLATATEAAAMAALGAVLLTIAFGRLNLTTIKETVLNTLQTSAMVMFLGVSSTIYGSVLNRLGTSTLIAKSMLALPLSPTMMLIAIMVVIFILGWPLEWPAIVFIFLPILLPVVLELKFDLVWFTTLVAVNLQTAFLSPPVALAAYYLKAVAPQWSLSEIYWGMIDFMILQVIGLALLFFFPQIALWLPRVLLGG